MFKMKTPTPKDKRHHLPLGKIFYFSLFTLFCSLFFAPLLCQAGEQIDKTRYITIDEIKPGMEAYCLTCYKGTKIEKFGLEVLSVVYNIRPGKNAIMVIGTDERFIHSGPVHGVSGSPLYIDGRIAGALAFGWSFSKDPLYGVTPIEEMLRTGELGSGEDKVEQAGFAFDYSAPIDFTEIDKQIKSATASKQNTGGGFSALRVPLITSGLPNGVCEQLNASVGPLGFTAVSGLGGGANPSQQSNVELVPGASLAVPVVTGDITMTAMGTVTEVVGNKVYGFGHSFLGHGPIDLPMATGQIHTVVAGVQSSFKLGSALEIVGALRADESTAVYGEIGEQAQMIPLTIKIDRYNDAEVRVYNCQVAYNRVLTLAGVRSAVSGAALMRGSLPPEHLIEYKMSIDIKGGEAITFENISANTGLYGADFLMNLA